MSITFGADRFTQDFLTRAEGGPRLAYEAGREYFKGRVISKGHEEFRIMSDVWEVFPVAYVLTDDMKAKRIVLNQDGDEATVDCPQDLMDFHEEIENVRAIGRYFLSAEGRQTDDHYNVGKGDYVEVVKGRKVRKGTIGKVFWMGRDNYANLKVGIAVTDRKDHRGFHVDVEWTALSNCRKVGEIRGRNVLAANSKKQG